MFGSGWLAVRAVQRLLSGGEHGWGGGLGGVDGEGADAGFEADDEFADGGLLGWGDLAGMADEADGDGVGGVGETPAGGGFDGAVWGAVAVADDEVGGCTEGLAAPA